MATNLQYLTIQRTQCLFMLLYVLKESKMRISPINSNQNNFKAVNPKYYKWAEREAKGTKGFGELFFQLKLDVSVGDIRPQDGIDTLKAIEKIFPEHRRKELNRVYDYIKSFLDEK